MLDHTAKWRGWALQEGNPLDTEAFSLDEEARIEPGMVITYADYSTTIRKTQMAQDGIFVTNYHITVIGERFAFDACPTAGDEVHVRYQDGTEVCYERVTLSPRPNKANRLDEFTDLDLVGTGGWTLLFFGRKECA